MGPWRRNITKRMFLAEAECIPLSAREGPLVGLEHC